MRYLTGVAVFLEDNEMSERMPEGRYYVGDLCYVLTDAQWDELLKLMYPIRTGPNRNKCFEGRFVLKGGIEVAYHGTAYGDGIYEDNEGREYSVDSGTIGCVKASHLDRKTKAKVKKLGQIVDIPFPFVSESEDGQLKFGNVTIDTSGEG